jgi:hypothetical protein
VKVEKEKMEEMEREKG